MLSALEFSPKLQIFGESELGLSHAESGFGVTVAIGAQPTKGAQVDVLARQPTAAAGSTSEPRPHSSRPPGG